MSDGAGSGSWTSMNDNLMALLEAVLSLAASDAAASQRPARPAVKPGGYTEDIFLDLAEDEQDEFSCSICYQVLRETMQCLNHHKFCHSCLYVWSTTGQYANRVRCPVCRCQGYYFRDDELDDRINKKKVKCSMESCRWTGPLKYLGVHRHTNYGGTSQRSRLLALRDDDTDEEEDEEDEQEGGRSTVLELPYLGRAPPRLPHHSQSRFGGTGLRARSVMSTTGVGEEGRNPTVQTITTRLDGSTTRLDGSTTGSSIGGGEGILLRERRGAAGRSENSESPVPDRRITVRQRVHPIRRSSVNRITVTHSDSNNNLPQTSSTATPEREMTTPRPGLSSSPETPRQPRPPSGPRPAGLARRRRLPSVQPSQTSRAQRAAESQATSPPAEHVIRAPPTFSATAASQRSTLTNFHDRLQESRDRLEGLMTNFSDELERSRQEMADFQVERERQRREQLAEVRELGRRLGQVASELRHLLGHRRLRPTDSDD